MKQSIVCLLSWFVVCMSGCAVLEHPLVAPDECKACPELHGSFKITSHAEEKVEIGILRVGSAGENFPYGFLKCVLVKQPNTAREHEDSAFIAFAEPVGDSYVIHIPLPHGFKMQPGGPDELVPGKQLEVLGDKWDEEKISGYLVLRLTKTESGHSLSHLDPGFLQKQIKARNLSGRKGRAGDPKYVGEMMRVTSDTAEIRKLFSSRSMDELFHRPDDFGFSLELKK